MLIHHFNRRAPEQRMASDRLPEHYAQGVKIRSVVHTQSRELLGTNKLGCAGKDTRSNPAHSVRGPKYVVKKGKTPVWSREDAKTLLDSIPKDSVSGLRDLALIAAMFYSFARVSAVLKLGFHFSGLKK